MICLLGMDMIHYLLTYSRVHGHTDIFNYRGQKFALDKRLRLLMKNHVAIPVCLSQAKRRRYLAFLLLDYTYGHFQVVVYGIHWRGHLEASDKIIYHSG